MSSNFWTSSHSRYHLHPRSHILSTRSLDLQYITPRQHYCLQIYFAGLLQKLGKRLMLRQIPIATAIVFFKRFYLKNAICETNPYLVLTACAYVAAKVEETPVHIKSVVAEAKAVFAENNIKFFPADSSKLGEMEFYLLEDLDFHLIVFHPYRALLAMTGREPADGGIWAQGRVEEDIEIRKRESVRAVEGKDLRGKGKDKEGEREEIEDETEEGRIKRLMSRGSGEGLMEIDEGVLQICLFLINDTYRTDLPLLYPPYLIALSTLYIGYCLTSINTSSTTTSTNSSNTTPRTRSSTQQTDPSHSITLNSALGLLPPPKGFAEFLATFQVSIPVLMACVQDVVVLYPIWEKFEPTHRAGSGGAGGAGVGRGMFGGTGMGAGQAGSTAGKRPPSAGTGVSTSTAGVAAGPAGGGGGGGTATEPTFGPNEAEALVRRMIEERAVDLLHPDDAGKQLAGRKRKA